MVHSPGFKQLFLNTADKKSVRNLFLLTLFLGLVLGGPTKAGPSFENTLTAHVVKKTLVEVLRNIASEIEGLKGEFPQLKHWHEAQIFADRIEYQYRFEGGKFGKDGCRLSILAREEPLFHSDSENPMELKVGLYLKMKAVGKRASLLKQTLLDIIAKEFEKIRNLNRNGSFS